MGTFSDPFFQNEMSHFRGDLRLFRKCAGFLNKISEALKDNFKCFEETRLVQLEEIKL